eukprot:SAG22_NODE_1280_length_4899_cov_5.374792_5_plen_189_part_00
MLQDHQLLSEAAVINSSFVHCSVTDYSPKPEDIEAQQQSAAGGTYVQFGSNGGQAAAGQYGQLEDTESWMAGIDVQEQERQMRMLERLATARRGAVAQTLRVPGGGGLPDPGAAGMDLVPGSSAEFLCGLSLGFCLGAIMVFVLWELRMSRQQRLGIILGIVANALFGIVSAHAKRVQSADAEFLAIG